MITLHQFPSAWGLPNASPFCMKVETYLRMCNLPYTTVNVLNPAKGPKGKLPYITRRGQHRRRLRLDPQLPQGDLRRQT